jgi:hypothetical protein
MKGGKEKYCIKIFKNAFVADKVCRPQDWFKPV